MHFKGQDILTTGQFDKEGLFLLFEEARKMEKIVESGRDGDLLQGKYMATLFFEASTRTRFSFETAMLRLGGKVVSNADMKGTSSLRKSESLADTGRSISQMVDVLVARHPEVGTLERLAEGSDVPVINAGEGAKEHPTQGLLDVYTIWKEKGSLDDLTIGLVGDLKNSRVLHSQCGLLRHFKVKFVLVSPEVLKLPDEIKAELGDFEETEEPAAVLADLDVLSCNRLQKERFENPEDCEKLRGTFKVTGELLRTAKNDLIILNPLPRLEELSPEVDHDPRAKYFEQIRNGVAVRMALLKLVLLG